MDEIIIPKSSQEKSLKNIKYTKPIRITLKENSIASILIKVGSGEIDIDIEDNAFLNLAIIQSNEGILKSNINTFKNSTCIFSSLQINGTNLESDIDFNLNEEGGNIENLCFIKAVDDQKITLHTKMIHKVPSTNGNNLIHSALYGKSQVYFEGLLRIDPNAQGTNTYLQDNTLLLSGDAFSQSIPSLEIEANDVKASHGATSGYIDENKLFYLKTRGIPEDIAKNMLVEAFFYPGIENIHDENIKKEFVKLLMNKD